MPKRYNHYSVFVSSPGDVPVERAICINVVQQTSANIAESLRLTLTPEVWEQLPPETPQPGNKTIQDELNDLVKKADIFVLILGSRYGTIEPSHDKSNTEREVQTILEKKKDHPQVTVLCYLKKLPENNDPGEQQIQNLAFRKRLSKYGVMWKEYIDHTDFEKIFLHDLYKLSIRLRLSPFKSECLSHFLSMPDDTHDIERPQDSELAIIYRPVLRRFLDQSRDANFWHKRLMPNVTFEDSKAIQKLQKITRLMGLPSRVYMVYNLPTNIKSRNRLWVCAPRMKAALSAASEANASFSFTKKERNSFLTWQPPGGKMFRIQSPLPKYIKEQREEDSIKGEWSERLGNIIAKDYGILARLPAPEDGASAPVGTIDYFVAGCHGLGTWGAAWYLDRKFREFQTLQTRGKVEILLEVTYRNGAILDVVDVSDKRAEYFESQNRLESVRKMLRDSMHH